MKIQIFAIQNKTTLELARLEAETSSHGYDGWETSYDLAFCWENDSRKGLPIFTLSSEEEMKKVLDANKPDKTWKGSPSDKNVGRSIELPNSEDIRRDEENFRVVTLVL